MAENKVQRLKDALLDELIDQFENGVKVAETDEETGEVSLSKVSVDSKIMTVASKVIKDFAHEADVDNETVARTEKLSQFLDRRRAARQPAPLQ